jgi:hypothetical protein
MKGLLGVAALGLVVFFASAAAGGNVKKDTVTGGFKDHFGFNNGFQAQSGPAGENPTGHDSATSPDTGERIREDVVCLAVDGNLAAAGDVGTITSGGTKSPIQEVLVFRDGGPGGAGDGFDSLGGDLDPNDCQDALAAAADAPSILSGNISINDAP